VTGKDISALLFEALDLRNYAERNLSKAHERLSHPRTAPWAVIFMAFELGETR
jgi:hypothetical protein